MHLPGEPGGATRIRVTLVKVRARTTTISARAQGPSAVRTARGSAALRSSARRGCIRPDASPIFPTPIFLTENPGQKTGLGSEKLGSGKWGRRLAARGRCDHFCAGRAGSVAAAPRWVIRGFNSGVRVQRKHPGANSKRAWLRRQPWTQESSPEISPRTLAGRIEVRRLDATAQARRTQKDSSGNSALFAPRRLIRAVARMRGAGFGE